MDGARDGEGVSWRLRTKCRGGREALVHKTSEFVEFSRGSLGPGLLVSLLVLNGFLSCSPTYVDKDDDQVDDDTADDDLADDDTSENPLVESPPFELDDGVVYSFFLQRSSHALELFALEDEPGEAPQGEHRVRVLHRAPMEGLVDVYFNGQQVPGMSGLAAGDAYPPIDGDSSGYSMFAVSDSYQLDVYPADATPDPGSALIAGYRPTLTPDTYVSLVLSGHSGQLSFVEAVDDLGEVMQGRARLRLFHLASALEAIDVHVEVADSSSFIVAAGLEPGELSPGWVLPSGEFHIDVYEAGATQQ